MTTSHQRPRARLATLLLTTSLVAAVLATVGLEGAPATQVSAVPTVDPPTVTRHSAAESRDKTTIPRFLIRPDFRFATPTRWCKSHRTRCLRHITKRFLTKYRHGQLGHTRWSMRSIRQVRPIFKRAYVAQCRDHGTLDDGQQLCPRGTRPVLEPQQAWERFRQQAGCSLRWIPYAGQPQYRMICEPEVDDDSALTDDEKAAIKCQAEALAATGAAAAVGGVLGGPPGAGAGALMGFGTGEARCAAGWVFGHFLDW